MDHKKARDAAQLLANELLKAGIDVKVWLAGDEVHVSCNDEDENDIYYVLEKVCGGSAERGTLYECDVCLIRYGWKSGTEQVHPDEDAQLIVTLTDQIVELVEDGLVYIETLDAKAVYDAYITAYHYELTDEDFFGADAERNSAQLHERIEQALACIVRRKQ